MTPSTSQSTDPLTRRTNPEPTVKPLKDHPVNVDSPYRVRIVVDPTFGERLASLLANEPVWIIGTPENRVVAERLWTEHPDCSHLTGITTFQPGSSGAEDELLSILGTVDEHHGDYSADPPYSILEVIGCSASDDVVAALDELGFIVTSSTVEGFNASNQVA